MASLYCWLHAGTYLPPQRLPLCPVPGTRVSIEVEGQDPTVRPGPPSSGTQDSKVRLSSRSASRSQTQDVATCALRFFVDTERGCFTILKQLSNSIVDNFGVLMKIRFRNKLFLPRRPAPASLDWITTSSGCGSKTQANSKLEF